ncbi:hypothetical protein K491DRAFT_758025 [Lophiostoma macrostomum CBS 122681]|uniref:Heterokaryon incompatibility domain-containing protein n=1 Tax=Lophiostoma macrostomum CBS 122681 TaxID=1314788 RepID=A0A6A6T8W8_9PLEO|nr:hypothetical protein K491DRAFT_758025 [Lophiostoma macrostomum CBS 122681]
MDHIPLPKNPTWGSFEVPCLVSPEDDDYDGDPRLFAEHKGWIARPWKEWNEIFKDPPDDFKAFMQHWRYFKLIFAVFSTVKDPRLSIHGLTRFNSQGKRILDTTRLPEAINDAMAKYPDPQVSNVKSILEFLLRIENGFTLMKRTHPMVLMPTTPISLATYCTEGPILVDVDPLPDVTRMSIYLLYEVICKAQLFKEVERTKPAFNLSNAARLANIPSSLGMIGLKDLASKRLLQSGWCPVRVEHFSQQFSPSGQMFAANIERLDTADHSTCSQESCCHDQVDNKRYQTAHVKGCPGCHEVSASSAELSKILESGSYPIVRLRHSSTGDSAISLHPYHAGVPYIAISHVWSDGLGNPQDNAVPLYDYNSKVLISLVKALRYRTTSVSSDEAICLANFLNLDTSTIMAIPSSSEKAAEKRMCAFWKMVSQVPVGYIGSLFARLGSDKLGWAPRTMLDEHPKQLVKRKYISITGARKNIQYSLSGDSTAFNHDQNSLNATRTEEGLRFCSRGLDLKITAEKGLQETMLLQTVDGKLFRAKILGPISGSSPLPIPEPSGSHIMMVVDTGDCFSGTDGAQGLIVYRGHSQDGIHFGHAVGVVALEEFIEEHWEFATVPGLQAIRKPLVNTGASVLPSEILENVEMLGDTTCWCINVFTGGIS